MVVVTVELWPLGDARSARPLGRVEIENDATGTAERGNYRVRLAHAGRFFGRPGVWRGGAVEGHARDLSPYHLVLRALEAALGARPVKAQDRDAWFEAFEERAAILEFDGGLERGDAERKALEMIGPPVRAKGAAL